MMKLHQEKKGLEITLSVSSTAMEKAKIPEEKLMHSETVKNLCDSLGVFLNLISDIEPYDDDGEPIPF